jgi:hypothetical protein
MKRHLFPLTATLLISSALSLLADPQFELELKRLQAEREKALAAAAEPINKRHQAALELLLRRATQAADLSSAVKIRDELQKLGAATAQPKEPVTDTAEALAQELIGTKWDWFNGEPLQLLADGKANWNHSSHLWSWKVLKPGQRVIEGIDGRNGNKFTITFDRKLETGKIEDWNPRSTRKLTDR